MPGGGGALRLIQRPTFLAGRVRTGFATSGGVGGWSRRPTPSPLVQKTGGRVANPDQPRERDSETPQGGPARVQFPVCGKLRSKTLRWVFSSSGNPHPGRSWGPGGGEGGRDGKRAGHAFKKHKAAGGRFLNGRVVRGGPTFSRKKRGGRITGAGKFPYGAAEYRP